MSRKDGVLRVVLTGKWFDMIESGEKLEEYRGAHWCHRLMTHEGCIAIARGLGLEHIKQPWGLDPSHFIPYRALVASRGYTSRTLTRKIKRIRWGRPRPEWSGDTVTGDCFIIEFEVPE